MSNAIPQPYVTWLRISDCWLWYLMGKYYYRSVTRLYYYETIIVEPTGSHYRHKTITWTCTHKKTLFERQTGYSIRDLVFKCCFKPVNMPSLFQIVSMIKRKPALAISQLFHSNHTIFTVLRFLPSCNLYTNLLVLA